MKVCTRVLSGASRPNSMAQTVCVVVVVVVVEGYSSSARPINTVFPQGDVRSPALSGIHR